VLVFTVLLAEPSPVTPVESAVSFTLLLPVVVEMPVVVGNLSF
jgi:hypothetical protein